MRLGPGLLVVASLLSPLAVQGQSPVRVKYCQDLSGAYRQAITSGKAPVMGTGAAVANCQTTPDDSIPLIEDALRKLDVVLPPK